MRLTPVPDVGTYRSTPVDDEAVNRRWLAAARRGFVGRERELTAFRDNIDDDVSPTMIFAVTGEPGSGKTTLLRRMRAEVRDRAVTVWVDGPAYGPLTVVRRLAAELGRWVDTTELDAALAAQADAVRRAGPVPAAAGHGPADERRNRLDELTPLLLDAVDRVIERGALVVVFLDDLGWPDDAVADWLVDVMGGVHGQFHPQFLFVVSGDASCTGPLVRYPFAVTPLGLARFTADETQAVVAGRGLDPVLAAAIHAHSAGLPAFVDLLAHPWSTDRSAPGPSDRPDPVAHLMRGVADRDVARALLRSAVPRWGGAAAHDAVYRGQSRDAARAWSAAAPAWRPPSRHVPGVHWHPVVRAALLDHLRALEPKRLRSAHQRLTRFHERGALDLAIGPPWSARHRVEADYHLVACAEDPRAAAAEVAARAVPFGPAGVGSVVAVHQALRERSAHATPLRDLAAALVADDLTAVAEATHALAADGPASIRRTASLSRWVATARPGEPTAVSADQPWTAAAVAAAAWHEGRYADAERAVGAALEADGADPWLRAVRGDARLRNGDPVGALDDLRVAAQGVGLDPWIAARTAVAALQVDRPGEAVGLLDVATGLGRDPVIIGLRGEALRRTGDLEAAADDLYWALAEAPDLPWAHVSLALAAAAHGDPVTAEAHLDRARTIAPYSPAVVAARAAVRRWRGDLDRALEDATIAIELPPGLPVVGPPDARSPLAGLYETAVSPPADAALLHLIRALVRRDLGDLAGARVDLDAAAAYDPSRAHVLIERSQVRTLLGDVDGALDDVDRWLGLDALNPEAHAQRGRLCLARGDAAGAVAAFTAALEGLPEDALILALRGAARRALGDGAGTIADHTAALALGFDEHWVHGQRGEALLRAGDLAAALADIDAALARSPHEAWLLQLRAEARTAPSTEWPSAAGGT